MPSNKVLCGKFTINFSLSQVEHDKISADQVGAMTDTAKIYLRHQLVALLEDVNAQVAHLGMTITLHEDL